MTAAPGRAVRAGVTEGLDRQRVAG